MQKYRIFFWMFLLPAGAVFAQSGALDTYLDLALESNIALQQKNLSYEKSLAALQEAKGLFFPRLSVQARYSVARGGRVFEIPAGDLVNPAYQNLNLLNQLARQAYPDYPALPEYPLIPNQEVNFLRETEHETLVRMSMPVFNSAILHNHRIKQHLVESERMNIASYRRELIKEVKTAYFNYAKAARGVEIYRNALALVEENLRTTESLFRNNKVTIDAVYQAEAQVKEVEQQMAQAEKNEKMAQAYFNFLLNRDYDLPIELPEDSEPSVLTEALEQARARAFQQREELQQFNHFLSVSDEQIKLNKGNRLPTVNLAVDYGFQGTQYSFGRDDDFAMGSLVLSWDLFNRTTGPKVQQAKIEKLELEKRKEEVRQQIGLQVVSAYYDLEAAKKQMEQARAEAEASEKALRLVQKKFSQGQANLVEWTNARTGLTNAQEKEVIARYDVQIKMAELERASATY